MQYTSLCPSASLSLPSGPFFRSFSSAFPPPQLSRKAGKKVRQKARQELEQTDPPVPMGRRGAKTCLVHDGAEPKPCTANVKWPQNGNLQQGPCLKNTMVPASERSQSPLSPSANASPTCYGSARNCDPIKHDPRMARPRSTCRSSPRSGERPKCECPGGKKATEYNAWTAAKKPPSYAPSVRCLIVGSAAGSCASKASKATNVRRAKKNRIISPITTPEHYQFPYFGHSRTYVTDPALSPNLTPPGRRSMRLPGQEKIQFAEFASKPKCALLDKPNDIPHLPDAKTSWFGRTKTYVTDPAVSPNLTPPLRG